MKKMFQAPRLHKADIPEILMNKLTGKKKKKNAMTGLWQYRKGSIRRRYATFGQNSGWFHLTFYQTRLLIFEFFCFS